MKRTNLKPKKARLLSEICNDPRVKQYPAPAESWSETQAALGLKSGKTAPKVQKKIDAFDPWPKPTQESEERGLARMKAGINEAKAKRARHKTLVDEIRHVWKLPDVAGLTPQISAFNRRIARDPIHDPVQMAAEESFLLALELMRLAKKGDAAAAAALNAAIEKARQGRAKGTLRTAQNRIRHEQEVKDAFDELTKRMTANGVPFIRAYPKMKLIEMLCAEKHRPPKTYDPPRNDGWGLTTLKRILWPNK